MGGARGPEGAAGSDDAGAFLGGPPAVAAAGGKLTCRAANAESCRACESVRQIAQLEP